MKILFIASGNSKDKDISPFIKSQGDSLQAEGIEVAYYLVNGKGFGGYLKNIPHLKAWLKKNPVDLIHAHYSLCGWVAVLAAGRVPVVLSLMGDDAQGTFTKAGKIEFKSRLLILATQLIQPFVKAIIVKSPNLESVVYRKQILHLIPNGVQLQQFNIQSFDHRNQLGLQADKKYVLFLGNPTDPNKNAALAQAAVQRLSRPDVVLLQPYPIPHDQVAQYLNAADAFVLCSYGEGSPNVVKEAMACNCPLVATRVGDVEWLLGDTPGCYTASFDPADFAEKLAACLDYSTSVGRTQGRQRLIDLGLDATTIARRLIKIYKKILYKKETVAPVKVTG
jgi:glycosyltransferase involved in cell wall biosynthesis